MSGRRWLGMIGLVAWLSLSEANACNTPVFRYALERWKPDAYEAVLFHQGPLPADAQAVLDELRAAGPNRKGLLNLTCRAVDVANDSKPPVPLPPDATLPWLVVRYPQRLQIETPVWSGPFNRENVKSLLESPARQEIARRLLAGESAVWLVLKCGDPKADQAVIDLLNAELKRLAKTVKLPEDESKPPAEKAPKDDKAKPAEPVLRVAFSVLAVARDDPAEQGFADSLLRLDPALANANEPLVVPIFGRGRAFCIVRASDVDPDQLGKACEYLCGACSCTVKADNPGFDLLLSADWETYQGGSQVKDPETPPLTGLSQFENPKPEPPTPAKASPPPTPAPAPPEPAPESGLDRRLLRNLGIALGGGLLLVLAGTFLLRPRKGRP